MTWYAKPGHSSTPAPPLHHPCTPPPISWPVTRPLRPRPGSIGIAPTEHGDTHQPDMELHWRLTMDLSRRDASPFLVSECSWNPARICQTPSPRVLGDESQAPTPRKPRTCLAAVRRSKQPNRPGKALGMSRLMGDQVLGVPFHHPEPGSEEWPCRSSPGHSTRVYGGHSPSFLLSTFHAQTRGPGDGTACASANRIHGVSRPWGLHHLGRSVEQRNSRRREAQSIAQHRSEMPDAGLEGGMACTGIIHSRLPIPHSKSHLSVSWYDRVSSPNPGSSNPISAPTASAPAELTEVNQTGHMVKQVGSAKAWQMEPVTFEVGCLTSISFLGVPWRGSHGQSTQSTFFQARIARRALHNFRCVVLPQRRSEPIFSVAVAAFSAGKRKRSSTHQGVLVAAKTERFFSWWGHEIW